MQDARVCFHSQECIDIFVRLRVYQMTVVMTCKRSSMAE